MKRKHFILIPILFAVVLFFQTRIVAVASVDSQFLTDLHLGSTHPDVLLLQKYLNAQGFIVAPTGPGSIGNETLHFGSGTKSALIAFQNTHKNEILIPSGLIQGSGNFFSATRNFANTHPLITATSTPIILSSSVEVYLSGATTTSEAISFPPPPSFGINLTPSTTIYRNHHRHVSTPTLIDPTIMFSGTSGLNDGVSFPYLVATVHAFSNSPGAITYSLSSGDPSQFSVNATTGQIYALRADSSGAIQIQATQAVSGSYGTKIVTANVTIFSLS
ncbi:MAG: parallel beta-helix repeat-containing protein [Candidatus Taylorbacteria bacterium]|nr:parallel beta-helix repeat-containing protein [Candidatus Taylorbacteria bacterium]